MRITYRQLKRYLDCLSDSQLDCDVTVETLAPDDSTECVAVEFRVIGEDSDSGLEINHPVLYTEIHDTVQASDGMVAEHIAAIYRANGFSPITS